MQPRCSACAAAPLLLLCFLAAGVAAAGVAAAGAQRRAMLSMPSILLDAPAATNEQQMELRFAATSLVKGAITQCRLVAEDEGAGAPGDAAALPADGQWRPCTSPARCAAPAELQRLWMA